ncbi:hypothetical protein [Kordia sp.]|uniref:hypothetical protein n=1 Tax=Kordia sp. TaxID=1965332 RepID=UPI003B5A1683
MKKSILEIKGVSELSKKEQLNTIGGVQPPKVYDAELCASCGGISLPNGYCLIASSQESCLEGDGGIGG